MVLQVEMVDGVSGTAEGEVPVFGLGHRKAVVGEYVSVYVVRRRGRRAQHIWSVYHPQLCSACTIDIVDGTGDTALDHRYPARQVQVVVLNLRDALVRSFVMLFPLVTSERRPFASYRYSVCVFAPSLKSNDSLIVGVGALSLIAFSWFPLYV